MQNIETWRPFVDTCRISICESTNYAVAVLLETIAPQYPVFCKAMQELVTGSSFSLLPVAPFVLTRQWQYLEHVDRMGDNLHQRVEDMFIREQDPFTANDSLIDAINTIRMKRFDQAMQQAIFSVGM